MKRHPIPCHIPKPARKPEPVSLSIVEVRVAEMIARHYSDELIAHEIGISVGTARQYRRQLEAARKAQKRGVD